MEKYEFVKNIVVSTEDKVFKNTVMYQIDKNFEGELKKCHGIDFVDMMEIKALQVLEDFRNNGKSNMSIELSLVTKKVGSTINGVTTPDLHFQIVKKVNPV